MLMPSDNNSTEGSLMLGKDSDSFSGVENSLKEVLANTIFMFNLYKKYHWQVRGRDFYQYHLLFDKHAKEQLPIIDAVAERLRTLGFIAPGMPTDVVKNKTIEESKLSEFTPLILCESLLKVHDAYLSHLRSTIENADEVDDEGTEDLLVSDVLRVHELQVWFIRSSVENTEVIT
jgi:starvation-inducible DNA-binding protein